MTPEALKDLIVDALDDGKGLNIVVLPVTQLTSIADYMVIATGSSNRHVKSLVDRVVDTAKQSNQAPAGIEGRESNEWVLLDVGDVLVHVMQAEARTFYDLERLWTELAESKDVADAESDRAP